MTKTAKKTSLDTVLLTATGHGWKVSQTQGSVQVNDLDNVTGHDRFRRNVYGKKTVPSVDLTLDNGHDHKITASFLENGSFHSAQRPGVRGGWTLGISTLTNLLKEIERTRPEVIEERNRVEAEAEAKRAEARRRDAAHRLARTTLFERHQAEYDALVEAALAELENES